MLSLFIFECGAEECGASFQAVISMIEVILDPDDITIHACSSIQLDYSTDEDGKPSVSHDDGGEGVSLEEEKSRMVLLLGSLNKTSSDALVVQDHQNIAYLGQTVGNVRQTSSDALVVQDHQNIAYLGQTVGNVRQTSSDALVVRDHQNIAYLGQTVGNVRQTSSDALVVQDHQNIAYLGQTVGNVRQTSSDALVVQDHQNIAYLGQTVGNVRQTSSDALVVQDHQNIAYLGQTVGNVRQTSSDALVVQDHQNIAYLGQTVGNVRQTSSDALVVQDHQNIAYLGQTVGKVEYTGSDIQFDSIDRDRKFHMSDDVPCLLMMTAMHNNIVVPGIIGTGNKSFIHISELGWLLAELGEQVQRRQQPSQEGRRCQLHSTPNSNILVHTSTAL
ncbi:hypothetical protein EMCRGX_G014425 [Ephydatia muelleri]